MSKNLLQTKTDRSRVWFLVSYADPAVIDNWLTKVCADGWALYASATYHDKDFYSLYDLAEMSEEQKDLHPVGSPKEPHTHILLKCRNATTRHTIDNHLKLAQSLAGIELLQNTLGDPTKYERMHECEDYELHLGYDWKQPYPIDAIKRYGNPDELPPIVALFPESRHEKIQVTDVINDMLKGYGTWELLQKYGNFYMRNMRNIEELYRKLRMEESFRVCGENATELKYKQIERMNNEN